MARKKEFHDQMASVYDMYSTGVRGDVKFYLRQCQQAKGKVLEIACGTGRILIPAIKAGVDIVGLDISKEMTDVLKFKAKELGMKPRIVLANMRSFKLKDRFSLIIIPYNSFLHMKTYDDQKKALNNFCRHLKPGGRLILNVFNPDLKKISRGYYPNHLRREVKGKFKYWDGPGRYDIGSQIIKTTQTVELLNKNSQVVKRIKSVLEIGYIFPLQFKAMLELTGFKRVELKEAFTDQPYSGKTKHLLSIAYK